MKHHKISSCPMMSYVALLKRVQQFYKNEKRRKERKLFPFCDKSHQPRNLGLFNFRDFYGMHFQWATRSLRSLRSLRSAQLCFACSLLSLAHLIRSLICGTVETFMGSPYKSVQWEQTRFWSSLKTRPFWGLPIRLLRQVSKLRCVFCHCEHRCHCEHIHSYRLMRE